MSGATGKVVRSVRVTGGPHETFGDTTVTVELLGREELGPASSQCSRSAATRARSARAA